MKQKKKVQKSARKLVVRQRTVRSKDKNIPMPWRRLSVLLVFVVLVLVLAGKALDMQVLHSGFYEQQGKARQVRTVTIAAHRGDIVDRNGQPLAISAPVKSIWINPGEVQKDVGELMPLAKLLSLNMKKLRIKIKRNAKREFMYLKRQVPPNLAAKVMALSIPGVATGNEYRRYYPSGEVTAHVLGFVDIDNNGQEGIELAYNKYLKGVPGKKRVIRDRLGRVFDDIERISPVKPGQSIHLSIDKRLQYLTYRTLKAAVIKNNAVAGSAVILDVKTGEILAMANQPSFNPNDRDQLIPQATRNRAVTDVFEPGSTMKPISIAAALESGRWKPSDKIETAPGYMKVDGNMIRDERNYGELSMGEVIEKSSNVGISKIVLSLDEETQWDMYRKIGFGVSTGSGFPGEASGRLSLTAMNNDFTRATMAYGYGISVTPLQLARAYAAIASNGILRPVSFLHKNHPVAVAGRRVMSAKTAREVRKMMQLVVSDKGTGKRARVANYSVAGKTGTVHKFIKGGYAKDHYISIFAGMIPANKPDLVMVVVIDDPRNGEYFGGLVAAPVFSKVMTGAVRLLDISPDKIAKKQLLFAQKHRPLNPATQSLNHQYDKKIISGQV